MKKIIHKPNGEIVEVEGTPEEIAAYEKKLKENVSEQPIPKTPGLLTDEVKKLLKDLDTSGLKHVPAVQHYPRHTEYGVNCLSLEEVGGRSFLQDVRAEQKLLFGDVLLSIHSGRL